ncbi:Predicted Zn-dependent peptidase [Parapedobacter indicus]|uniref:Predicted Zn-dependent peptidase n=2 Tax=Parapedobacter indicus TaxID=1477437 RepID=A0A1I3LGG5_9SPHI|nr:putative Zn-dependent peptidase [Parapedobacter indicus]SFI83854.1 Predicted Zn-dependent peptidase [Parapedobacter indicus]
MFGQRVGAFNGKSHMNIVSQMKKILSITAFFGLLLCKGVVADAQSRIEFKEFKLKNGLTVLMHRDHTTPIVAVSVMYHVGSKNENPERTGFAHFFEHLLFEGTENIGRGEFMKKIESIGGTLNAYTTNDITYYHEVVPANYLETALYMESERMLHAKIDTVGVETQRNVVKEEMRQRYDNQPYGTILRETFKRSHRVHPYHWPVIGSLDHLNAATLDEFMQFYRTYYVPNNAVLSIAGDIDYAQAETWIRAYFSEIPVGIGTINRPNITEPKRTQEIKDVVYDNIQLPAVVLAYNLPSKKHRDSYALNMLSTYLTGGNSSLLTKELVDKQQKAVAVAAFPLDLEDGGVFLAYAVANMGISADTVQRALDEQIEKVIASGISETDFQKLQAQTENDVVSRHASVAGIAESLAEAKTFFGDADEVNHEMEKYNKVTREDIQRVAKQYLAQEGRVVLYYLPKSEEPKQ